MQFQIELHSHVKTRTLVYFSSIQIVPSFQNDKLKEREEKKKKKKTNLILISLQQNVFSMMKIFVTKCPVFCPRGPLAMKSTF